MSSQQALLTSILLALSVYSKQHSLSNPHSGFSSSRGPSFDSTYGIIPNSDYNPNYSPGPDPGPSLSDPSDSKPGYHFQYEEADDAGDFKSQGETRDGEMVKGFYTVMDAGGSKRTIEYTADHEKGFYAIVHRSQASYPQYAHQYQAPKYGAPTNLQPKTLPEVFTGPKFDTAKPYSPEYEGSKYETRKSFDPHIEPRKYQDNKRIFQKEHPQYKQETYESTHNKDMQPRVPSNQNKPIHVTSHNDDSVRRRTIQNEPTKDESFYRSSDIAIKNDNRRVEHPLHDESSYDSQYDGTQHKVFKAPNPRLHALEHSEHKNSRSYETYRDDSHYDSIKVVSPPLFVTQTRRNQENKHYSKEQGATHYDSIPSASSHSHKFIAESNLVPNYGSQTHQTHHDNRNVHMQQNYSTKSKFNEPMRDYPLNKTIPEKYGVSELVNTNIKTSNPYDIHYESDKNNNARIHPSSASASLDEYIKPYSSPKHEKQTDDPTIDHHDSKKYDDLQYASSETFISENRPRPVTSYHEPSNNTYIQHSNEDYNDPVKYGSSEYTNIKGWKPHFNMQKDLSMHEDNHKIKTPDYEQLQDENKDFSSRNVKEEASKVKTKLSTHPKVVTSKDKTTDYERFDFKSKNPFNSNNEAAHIHNFQNERVNYMPSNYYQSHNERKRFNPQSIEEQSSRTISNESTQHKTEYSDHETSHHEKFDFKTSEPFDPDYEATHLHESQNDRIKYRPDDYYISLKDPKTFNKQNSREGPSTYFNKSPNIDTSKVTSNNETSDLKATEAPESNYEATQNPQYKRTEYEHQNYYQFHNDHEHIYPQNVKEIPSKIINNLNASPKTVTTKDEKSTYESFELKTSENLDLDYDSIHLHTSQNERIKKPDDYYQSHQDHTQFGPQNVKSLPSKIISKSNSPRNIDISRDNPNNYESFYLKASEPLNQNYNAAQNERSKYEPNHYYQIQNDHNHFSPHIRKKAPPKIITNPTPSPKIETYEYESKGNDNSDVKAAEALDLSYEAIHNLHNEHTKYKTHNYYQSHDDHKYFNNYNVKESSKIMANENILPKAETANDETGNYKSYDFKAADQLNPNYQTSHSSQSERTRYYPHAYSKSHDNHNSFGTENVKEEHLKRITNPNSSENTKTSKNETSNDESFYLKTAEPLKLNYESTRNSKGESTQLKPNNYYQKQNDYDHLSYQTVEKESSKYRTDLNTSPSKDTFKDKTSNYETRNLNYEASNLYDSQNGLTKYPEHKIPHYPEHNYHNHFSNQPVMEKPSKPITHVNAFSKSEIPQDETPTYDSSNFKSADTIDQNYDATYLHKAQNEHVKFKPYDYNQSHDEQDVFYPQNDKKVSSKNIDNVQTYPNIKTSSDETSHYKRSNFRSKEPLDSMYEATHLRKAENDERIKYKSQKYFQSHDYEKSVVDVRAPNIYAQETPVSNVAISNQASKTMNKNKNKHLDHDFQQFESSNHEPKYTLPDQGHSHNDNIEYIPPPYNLHHIKDLKSYARIPAPERYHDTSKYYQRNTFRQEMPPTYESRNEESSIIKEQLSVSRPQTYRTKYENSHEIENHQQKRDMINYETEKYDKYENQNNKPVFVTPIPEDSYQGVNYNDSQQIPKDNIETLYYNRRFDDSHYSAQRSSQIAFEDLRAEKPKSDDEHKYKRRQQPNKSETRNYHHDNDESSSNLQPTLSFVSKTKDGSRNSGINYLTPKRHEYKAPNPLLPPYEYDKETSYTPQFESPRYEATSYARSDYNNNSQQIRRHFNSTFHTK